MKQNTLKMPGINVPRIFVFMHGYFSGICKVAGLDPENGYICSGYIFEKLNLFDSLSHSRVKMLEDETKGVRVEALDIMAEEAQIRQQLREEKAKDDEAKRNEMIPDEKPTTIQEAREARLRQANRLACRSRISTNQEQLTSKHNENIKRLVEINKKISSCELRAQEELEATAAKLKSIFATYAKGALLRPILPNYIPPITIYDFELYKKSHEAEDQQMRLILKEVYSYE